MTFKVLVADNLSHDGLAVFDKSDAVELADKAGITRDDLLAQIHEYDALVVRSRTQVDAEVIEAATHLKVVGRAGIGVDNVDVRAATRAGVVVMNTPDGNATTTAEHTVSLIMSMSRMIPQATASMKAGKWDKKAFMGRELRGKTLGVVGLGNIGQIVADRARGLHMKVIGHDPYFDPQAAEKIGIEWVPFDELVARADVITVHTPLNDETRGLIGHAQIERMKPGVMLVNCARGGIYDEDALIAGLESGKIGGIALDVYSTEPPPPDQPLLKHERVVCTPHLGASTKEAQAQVAHDIAEQIVEFASGGPARNALNMPRMTASQLKTLGPWLDLAERMGSFCTQVQEGPINKVEIKLAGAIAENPVDPMTTAVLVGVLRHAFDRPVNAVSARVIAEERGIQIVESYTARPMGGFASSIGVAVSGKDTSTERHSVVGTIFDGGSARLVEVDNVRIEAIPEGELLFILNDDKPGVIGHIGTVIGKAGINIARMHLGLPHQSGRALSLVTVDAPPPEELLDELATGDVIAVRHVSL